MIFPKTFDCDNYIFLKNSSFDRHNCTLSISFLPSHTLRDRFFSNLNFSNNLIEIKDYVASGTKIKNLDLGANLEIIGDFFGGFYGGPSFFDSIIFGDKLHTIGRCFLANSKTKTLTLPKSIQHIGEKFGFDSQLESVVFLEPSCLKTISRDFLHNCPIESIIFPEGVTNFSELALSQCKNLKEILLPSTTKTIHKTSFPDIPEGGPKIFLRKKDNKESYFIWRNSEDFYKNNNEKETGIEIVS